MAANAKMSRPTAVSKVQKFYAEFSDFNSENSDRIFVFDGSDRLERKSVISFGSNSPSILSPGLTNKQDIKDAALESFYKRRIHDLKRI